MKTPASCIPLWEKRVGLSRIFGAFLSLLFAFPAASQCPFDPLVTGDTLLCPAVTGQLTTQAYDAYQWYKRPLFGGTSSPIPGATSQSIQVDAFNDAGYYFKVEATDSNCTEFSPEVLVDGWAFLPPVTIISGNFTIGSNGELILCQGDTIFLVAGLPYDTSLTWFNQGQPIAGATDDTLIVTTAGSYYFMGAPSECPAWIQTQSIPTDVTVITCPTGVGEHPGYELSLVPEPGFQALTFYQAGCRKAWICNAMGQVVLAVDVDNASPFHRLDIRALVPGYYTACTEDGYRKRCAVFVRP